MGVISNWGERFERRDPTSNDNLRRTGNLPLATIQVLGLSAPFDGESDVELGIAYVSSVWVASGLSYVN